MGITVQGFSPLAAHYDILEVLGEVGMGVVYRARQASIDREVAVKMLRPEMGINESTRRKFLSEAAVTGELDHPNIVPIYDLGQNADGALFYSMKKVQGTPWSKVIKEKSVLDNLTILMKVSDAVAFAHARGVVHRDLKPENVMLGDFGEVLVLDWGLAVATEGHRETPNVSAAYNIAGTPAYKSPEKFKERGIKTVLLDECQQIKNPDASRTQMIRRVVKECDAKVIPISGTPWENRGSELFTVLNMMAPYKFPSYQGFARRWVAYYYRGNSMKEAGIRNIEAFREYTKDIMIRRQRIEVMPELPLVNRTKLFTELDNISQEAYDGEVSDFVKWWNQILADEEENTFETQTNLLAKLARMRHITGLAKIPATIDWIEEFVEETDRKLIVFVHHKDVLAIILQQCRERFGEGENAIWVSSLPGGITAEEKFRTQEEFNSKPRAILLASTRSSGEGLNLQTCCDCVMHERQWNPSKEETSRV